MFGWIAKKVGEIGSAAIRTVKKVARFTGDTLRKVANAATKAINYVAARGPEIMARIKEGVEKTKQVVDTLKKGLEFIIKTKIGKHPTFGPLLNAAIVGLEGLEKVLDHALIRNLEENFRKALNLASRLTDIILDAAELADIIANRENIRSARRKANGVGNNTFNIADYIYSIAITRTKIKDALDTGHVKSFEDYLGLKATQKLLGLSQEKLLSGQEQTHIDPDDIVLVHAAEAMLGTNEDISNDMLADVDAIIKKRQNRGLYPFVFEEMIISWQDRINTLDKENTVLSHTINRNEITIEDMEFDALMDDLTAEQVRTLETLKAQHKRDTETRNEQLTTLNSLQIYIHASEGLLQYLENPEQFAEEKDYLVEHVDQVAHLIINSAQNELPLSELDSEDRLTIVHFANIFAEASKERAEHNRIVEVSQ